TAVPEIGVCGVKSKLSYFCACAASGKEEVINASIADKTRGKTMTTINVVKKVVLKFFIFFIFLVTKLAS
ncbi:hypothetical protein GW920_03685, partial [Candidatus Falkowbacteria bacterium]|nr:hypothetical protein [Candidatus Falkowbacteria bacterium]